MKTSLTLLASLVALAAAGPGHHDGCEEACKKATGLGAGDCVTECRADTDVASDQDEALADHVSEWTTNEAGSEPGGEAMEKVVEEEYGNTVPDCEAEKTEEPTFEEVDSCVSGEGDGSITPDEIETYAHKMCVDPDFASQMFSMADLNQDGVVDKDEWDKAGEDSEFEDEVDEAVDPEFEGDDEYKHVQMPPFEEFDEDGDGALDESEVKDAVEFEVDRRGGDEEEAAKHHDEIVEEVDDNGDGKISKGEFEHEEDDEDMGDELEEAEDKPDNPAEDPDDLHRGASSLPTANFAVKQARRLGRRQGGGAKMLLRRRGAAQGARSQLRALAARKRAAKGALRLIHKLAERRQASQATRARRGRIQAARLRKGRRVAGAPRRGLRVRAARHRGVSGRRGHAMWRRLLAGRRA